MKVLWLGPARASFQALLSSAGDEVERTEEPLSPDGLAGFEFVVSYGYRYKVGAEVLAALPEKIVNLHASFLPWNRGADPNLWSFLEDTPKGVTIHRMDAGIDTGPVLAQRGVSFSEERTLRETYARLEAEMESLFKDAWPLIRAGRLFALSQPPGGSVHRTKDRERFADLLTDGWDTPVAGLIGRALT